MLYIDTAFIIPCAMIQMHLVLSDFGTNFHIERKSCIGLVVFFNLILGHGLSVFQNYQS